ASVAPSRSAREVLYRRRSISELYRSGHSGLEQALVLRNRPRAGNALLVLALRVRGPLLPEQVGSQVVFKTGAGATALRYGQLNALDATGRKLPALMRVSRGSLQLLIDDRGSRYPVRVTTAISPVASPARAAAAAGHAPGSVMAWGANFDGQLGDGSTAQSDVPVPVSGLSGVSAVSAGRDHSLAL